MHTRSPFAAGLPIAAACALLLAGCFGSTPPSHFYVLAPLPGAAPAGSTPYAGALVVGPVTLPPEIDRPQLVTQLGTYERQVHELSRWAAPLSEHVARVLAEDLSARLQSNRVSIAPVKGISGYDRRVGVDIAVFDVVPGGDCILTARWIVYDVQGKVLLAQQTTVRAPTEGKDPEQLVRAMSRSLAGLADTIAEAVRTLKGSAGG
jgi:uncharacterized lipoprotein YmbA